MMYLVIHEVAEQKAKLFATSPTGGSHGSSSKKASGHLDWRECRFAEGFSQKQITNTEHSRH